MITITETKIHGCIEIQPEVFSDERGKFIKIFHLDIFRKLELATDYKEEYYTHSRKGVLRGMHFQIPPHDHDKIVYCVNGAVFDVVVDLRCGSPSYGKAEVFTLNSTNGKYIYLPRGLAHGFLSTTETATLVYKVTSTYVPASDTGIHWSSIDVTWPAKNPIVSKRDSAFIKLSSFNSPFIFDNE